MKISRMFIFFSILMISPIVSFQCEEYWGSLYNTQLSEEQRVINFKADMEKTFGKVSFPQEFSNSIDLFNFVAKTDFKEWKLFPLAGDDQMVEMTKGIIDEHIKGLDSEDIQIDSLKEKLFKQMFIYYISDCQKQSFKAYYINVPRRLDLKDAKNGIIYAKIRKSLTEGLLTAWQNEFQTFTENAKIADVCMCLSDSKEKALNNNLYAIHMALGKKFEHLTEESMQQTADYFSNLLKYHAHVELMNDQEHKALTNSYAFLKKTIPQLFSIYFKDQSKLHYKKFVLKILKEYLSKVATINLESAINASAVIAESIVSKGGLEEVNFLTAVLAKCRASCKVDLSQGPNYEQNRLLALEIIVALSFEKFNGKFDMVEGKKIIDKIDEVLDISKETIDSIKIASEILIFYSDFKIEEEPEVYDDLAFGMLVDSVNGFLGSKRQIQSITEFMLGFDKYLDQLYDQDESIHSYYHFFKFVNTFLVSGSEPEAWDEKIHFKPYTKVALCAAFTIQRKKIPGFYKVFDKLVNSGVTTFREITKNLSTSERTFTSGKLIDPFNAKRLKGKLGKAKFDGEVVEDEEQLEEDGNEIEGQRIRSNPLEEEMSLQDVQKQMKSAHGDAKQFIPTEEEIKNQGNSIENLQEQDISGGLNHQKKIQQGLLKQNLVPSDLEEREGGNQPSAQLKKTGQTVKSEHPVYKVLEHQVLINDLGDISFRENFITHHGTFQPGQKLEIYGKIIGNEGPSTSIEKEDYDNYLKEFEKQVVEGIMWTLKRDCNMIKHVTQYRYRLPEHIKPEMYAFINEENETVALDDLTKFQEEHVKCRKRQEEDALKELSKKKIDIKIPSEILPDGVIQVEKDKSGQYVIKTDKTPTDIDEQHNPTRHNEPTDENELPEIVQGTKPRTQPLDIANEQKKPQTKLGKFIQGHRDKNDVQKTRQVTVVTLKKCSVSIITRTESAVDDKGDLTIYLQQGEKETVGLKEPEFNKLVEECNDNLKNKMNEEKPVGSVIRHTLLDCKVTVEEKESPLYFGISNEYVIKVPVPNRTNKFQETIVGEKVFEEAKEKCTGEESPVYGPQGPSYLITIFNDCKIQLITLFDAPDFILFQFIHVHEDMSEEIVDADKIKQLVQQCGHEKELDDGLSNVPMSQSNKGKPEKFNKGLIFKTDENGDKLRTVFKHYIKDCYVSIDTDEILDKEGVGDSRLYFEPTQDGKDFKMCRKEKLNQAIEQCKEKSSQPKEEGAPAVIGTYLTHILEGCIENIVSEENTDSSEILQTYVIYDTSTVFRYVSSAEYQEAVKICQPLYEENYLFDDGKTRIMRYYIDNCVISMVYEEHPGSERYDIYYYEGSPTGVNKELDEYEQYLALKKGCDSDTVISPKKSIQTEEEIEQEPFDEEENSRHKKTIHEPVDEPFDQTNDPKFARSKALRQNKKELTNPARSIGKDIENQPRKSISKKRNVISYVLKNCQVRIENFEEDDDGKGDITRYYVQKTEKLRKAISSAMFEAQNKKCREMSGKPNQGNPDERQFFMRKILDLNDCSIEEGESDEPNFNDDPISFQVKNEDGFVEILEGELEFKQMAYDCNYPPLGLSKQQKQIPKTNKFANKEKDNDVVVKKLKGTSPDNIINDVTGLLKPSEIEKLQKTPELIAYLKANPKFLDEKNGIETTIMFVQITRGESPCAETIKK